jgi:hypothetical protein
VRRGIPGCRGSMRPGTRGAWLHALSPRCRPRKHGFTSSSTTAPRPDDG